MNKRACAFRSVSTQPITCEWRIPTSLNKSLYRDIQKRTPRPYSNAEGPSKTPHMPCHHSDAGVLANR